MKRLISLMLISAALLILPLDVFADSGIGYDIEVSSNCVSAGSQVTVVISLTGYTVDCSEKIRGIQVDVNNIDTQVLNVVSYNTLIDDDSVASNKVVYSESNKRLRLLYANFNGYLDTPCGEIMQIVFKVNEDIASTGSITLPVTLKISTANQSITFNSNCEISYTMASHETFQIDVTWGALDYTYSDGIWNAEMHKYDDSGWTCVSGADRVSVYNRSALSVNVEFTYLAKSEHTEIKGSFSDLSGNPINGNREIAPQSSVTAGLQLFGKPKTTLSSEIIGSVTLIISEVN